MTGSLDLKVPNGCEFADLKFYVTPPRRLRSGIWLALRLSLLVATAMPRQEVVHSLRDT